MALKRRVQGKRDKAKPEQLVPVRVSIADICRGLRHVGKLPAETVADVVNLEGIDDEGLRLGDFEAICVWYRPKLEGRK